MNHSLRGDKGEDHFLEACSMVRTGFNFKRKDMLTTSYGLLSRLQNWDDQNSWNDFFETYWRLIYSQAIKSGLTEAEAQDAVQETVVCVAKDIHKFQRDRKQGTFKGWLRNLTRWRIADQLRKRKPSNARPDEESSSGLEEIPDLTTSADEMLWEQEWQANVLATAIERVKRCVKEEHYQIFDLYVVKRWPVARVARRLGVSVAQVYQVKHRIVVQIKQEVQAIEKRLF